MKPLFYTIVIKNPKTYKQLIDIKKIFLFRVSLNYFIFDNLYPCISTFLNKRNISLKNIASFISLIKNDCEKSLNYKKIYSLSFMF